VPDNLDLAALFYQNAHEQQQGGIRLSAVTGSRRRRSSIGTFKHLDVRAPVPIESLAAPVRPRQLSPRQRAILARHEEIKRVVNEAAVAAESMAIPVRPRPDQKLSTLRAAIARVVKETGSAVNVGVRGDTIYLSRGSLPGRGGRRKSG
jgi:hypothetical protein